MGETSHSRNRPLSALISNLEDGLYPARESFGNTSVFLPWRLSPDCTLNPGIRPEYLPDLELSRQERGVLHGASRGARVVDPRPFPRAHLVSWASCCEVGESSLLALSPRSNVSCIE